MPEPLFDLIKAKLQAAVEAHQRRLNADLFASIVVPRRPPLTRWQRMKNRIWPIRRYFVTLWLALKGADPFESDDW